jgi:predicted metal-dependent hydrolase
MISYTIKSSLRAKSIRITVYRDGTVVVTKPTRVSGQQVASLVEKKKVWIEKKVQQFAKKPAKILAHCSARDFKEQKKNAQELVRARITYFNTFYQYDISSITIRNQSSRWGSCSRRKNLNFNYKIVFLPQALQDYIIVHELCHLGQMNHSPRFLDLVAQQIPDHKLLRAQLRKY